MRQRAKRRGAVRPQTNSSIFSFRAIAAILAVGLLTVVVTAADSGTISGVVGDTVGKPAAGARVSADDSTAGLHRETITDSKGAYSFNNLPQGTYRITAELAGFQSARYTNVKLKSGKTLSYDFRLNPGSSAAMADLGSDPMPELDLDALLSGKWATDSVATATKQKTMGGLLSSIIDSGVRAGGSAVPTGGRNGGFGGGGGGFGGGGFGGGGGGFGNGGVATSGARSGQFSRNVIIDVPTINGVATVIPAAPTLNGQPLNSAGENPFVPVAQTQLSTFSIDVDTASYSNVRRFITQNQRPPRNAVRIEELVNYFSYDYPIGSSSDPITGNVEVASAPWNSEHRLVRIGVRAKPVQRSQKAANLVFLIDVSGSMAPNERLPLLKSAMRMLVDRLTESDLISIVTYAGSAGIALQPTSGDRKDTILKAIENLRAEGGTNGGAGIQTAYDLAVANVITDGVNRVVLATDGDFNVGVTNQNDLVRLIESKAKSSVFLTVLGVGRNFQDAFLEKLADRGNGNYAFLDTLNEARKVLLDQMDATFVTVAKDVKIQVEFNPERVSSYRLIGYEDRMLAAADFNNDAKDAGEMGAGHTVTAFYEIVPRSIIDSDRPSSEPRFEGAGVDPLRYRQVNAPGSPISDELMNLRIRYKEPDGVASKVIDFPLVDRGQDFRKASSEFRFAASVAAFGMILRESPHRGSADWAMVRRIASESKGSDRSGYREEFIGLVEKASETWLATNFLLR